MFTMGLRRVATGRGRTAKNKRTTQEQGERRRDHTRSQPGTDVNNGGGCAPFSPPPPHPPSGICTAPLTSPPASSLSHPPVRPPTARLPARPPVGPAWERSGATRRRPATLANPPPASHTPDSGRDMTQPHALLARPAGRARPGHPPSPPTSPATSAATTATIANSAATTATTAGAAYQTKPHQTTKGTWRRPRQLQPQFVSTPAGKEQREGWDRLRPGGAPPRRLDRAPRLDSPGGRQQWERRLRPATSPIEACRTGCRQAGRHGPPARPLARSAARTAHLVWRHGGQPTPSPPPAPLPRGGGGRKKKEPSEHHN